MTGVFILLLTCWGSIFVNTSLFTDTQIVPKWICFLSGVSCYGYYISIRFFSKKEHHNIYILIIGIIILCILQALYGIVQYISNSKGFVSGSFDNPAGLSSCIVAATPLLYGIKTNKWIYISVILLTSITLLLSCSRSGIIAAYFVLVIIFIRSKINYKWKFLILLSLIITVIICALYVKSDSTKGRLLIWLCSIELIKKSLWFGQGYGAFAKHYMNIQAEFFAKNPNNDFIPLADNVTHPFNEILSLLIVGGLFLFLILLIYVYFLIYCYKKSPSKLSFAALLSLTGVFICSIPSYPFTYPFTWFIVLLDSWILISNAFPIKVILYKVRYSLQISIFLISSFGLSKLYNRVKNELQWKQTYEYKVNSYERIASYKSLMNKLNRNPYFLYNYATELYKTKNYDDCLTVAKQCYKYWADYDLELLLGNTYRKLGKLKEAETHYITASYMCPVRFVPLYNLALLYRQFNKIEQSDSLAYKIIRKRVKISSPDISAIKLEMKLQLEKSLDNFDSIINNIQNFTEKE